MLGTAVFAVTGVLAVTRRGLDIFGALVLGMVTALGGGTIRDLIIGAAAVLARGLQLRVGGMSRDIYATPRSVAGFAITFGLHALAIHRHLEMPEWLTHRDDREQIG